MLIQYTCQRCAAQFVDHAHKHRQFCGHTCATTSLNERRAQHGMTRSPEWEAWNSMRDRCLQPNSQAYPSYGGRGITICDAWKDSFTAFLADVGRRPSAEHSIDRLDNNLGYFPDNVAWRTRTEQGRNKRNNHLLTFNGETRCVSEWADVIGIRATTLFRRLRKGWTVERALSTGKNAGSIAATKRWRDARQRFTQNA